MEKGAEFPTFDCVITNSKMGYDSNVELYFSLERQLASVLASLRFEDQEWKANYETMINYLNSLGDYLTGGPLPDASFLVELSKGMRIKRSYSYNILAAAKDRRVSTLGQASGLALQLMHTFAKLGKEAEFKGRFNAVAFAGLPYLEDILWRRAQELSQNDR
jgi:hypothetical protein